MDFGSSSSTAPSFSSSSSAFGESSSHSSSFPFSKKSFFTHVFSGSDESKAEFLNAVQYSFMGIIPVIALNKSIQRFSPEADPEKPSVEILAEVFIQLIIMFCGIIVIHRIITYFPTYSGYKYEHLELTNVILAFLIIILSIQTKIGLKVNIIYDRIVDLWNGVDGAQNNNAKKRKNGTRSLPNGVSIHSPSQADYLDNHSNSAAFPSAPISSVKQNPGGYEMIRGAGGGGNNNNNDTYTAPIMAANSVLGSSFGSSFY